MFDDLSNRLDGILQKIKGKSTLTEKNIKSSMREVRTALLGADVNILVVKKFVNSVQKKAIGAEVKKSLSPSQQVVKIVYNELVELMGEKFKKIKLSSQPPTVIMLAGLQGSGKTTSCGKLAKQFLQESHKPLLVACDVYRPAAVDQLKTIGKQIGVTVFEKGTSENPVNIAKQAIEFSYKNGNDIVIIDTAGRLHIDEKLMIELSQIKREVKPKEILFVADAMTGQDAVNVAKKFNDEIDISGVILTKMDGDARGGAALSIKTIINKPIKYIGVGEKLDLLEPFHPDRIASRILGMGDVLTLIEKAEAVIDKKEAERLQRKLLKESFTFEDFKSQIDQVKKLGPIDQLLNFIPGAQQLKSKLPMQDSQKELNRIEAIINSMTKEERNFPSILNRGRKKRIAKGSGTKYIEVDKLVKQFNQVKKMMKKIGKGKGMPRMPFLMK